MTDAAPAGAEAGLETRLRALVGSMTLDEKIGQMTQVDRGAVTPEEVARLGIGSVLSGGGGNPTPNDAAHWRAMVTAFTEGALGSRLGIPLLYGTDAVHGHSNVRGATIFPHNIGLGAAGDEDLVERVARATALEVAATGARWTFAPTVAVPQDIRWGRTYEGYGRDPELVARLGTAAVRGLQGSRPPVLSCLKHYVGDGGTAWGSVVRPAWAHWWAGWPDEWQIDQGDLPVDEATLRAVHLRPYVVGVAAGAMSVMASYSSWQGRKLHEHRYLLTDVLKGELGFRGFVVSDWMGIDQLDPDYGTCVVRSIDAGIDMVMVPFDHDRFRRAVRDGVEDGRIPIERIDDAVLRILRAKAAVGLEAGRPEPPLPPLDVVGNPAHRALAAEAARRGAVLLVDRGALPIDTSIPIRLAGAAADDIGLQCGGWTVEWQGAAGPITEGTTLLEAMRSRGLAVEHDPTGAAPDRTPVGIVCLAEAPYAEGLGDRALPTVRDEDLDVYRRMRARCDRLIAVVYSGRPVLIEEVLGGADAVIAAWLPGSEATELPDLLTGAAPFTGRLPQPWPVDARDLERQAATSSVASTGTGRQGEHAP